VPAISEAYAKFAVIEHSGTQYKITIDDTIVADRMEGVDIGDKISIDKVRVAI
jgi:ribosomal protein L21